MNNCNRTLTLDKYLWQIVSNTVKRNRIVLALSQTLLMT